jgi:hypothetical protein
LGWSEANLATRAFKARSALAAMVKKGTPVEFID